MSDPGSARSRPDVDVSAGCSGVLTQWPVHDEDLVDAGDPIARPYQEVPA